MKIVLHTLTILFLSTLWGGGINLNYEVKQ